jgi:capsular polysaccharide biosynthesis protein
MEFRQYAQILRRRWRLPLLLAALVALASLIQLQPWRAAPPSYQATLRLLVGVLPAAEADVAAYDPRYYAWLTSEYLVDDFTEVVRSELFARNVSGRLAGQGIDVPAGAIQGSAATGEQHRILTLNLTWGDEAQLQAIAAAAAAELSENAVTYFQLLGTEGAGVTLLDGPSIGVVGPSLRSRVELPLRMLLGLLVGVGLVFFLHYLDTAVRDGKELEALGFTVIATIPKEKQKR